MVHNKYDWVRYFTRSVQIAESSELYKYVKEWLHKNHPLDQDPCLEANVEGTDRGAIVYSPSFPPTTIFDHDGTQFAIDWERRRDAMNQQIPFGFLPEYGTVLQFLRYCGIFMIAPMKAAGSCLVNDVKDLLVPESHRKYSRQGSPYQRGYLLAGPPGTGKSSLCVALAGFTRLNIYTILFSDKLDENGLNTLFQELPEHCIVLLEDFDVTSLQISRHPESRSDHSGKSRLSLCCLLNVFDGVAAHEGRILILTANDAGKLDPSLIQPGHIDKTIHFGYANQQLAQGMFLTFYFEIPHGILVRREMPRKGRKPATLWSLHLNLHEHVAQLLEDEGLHLDFFDVDDEKSTIGQKDTNVMGRFVCQNNGCKSTGWSSKKIAITIRMYPGQLYNARVYHQRCRNCNDVGQLILDEECYAERVAYRLKKWNGIAVPVPNFSGQSRGPHDRALCEGCKAGHCANLNEDEDLVSGLTG
ncbi:hypothetical protein AJ79_09681 [Helicocarpus griseus UAMH5409]|uniref:AAA+ ATPase domain-containing protein n=1 Tax=Helicocarpus griseus UAMH5409 TaxID=1447875 RepID=A0A2B7WHX6_9EURO|nr:hypothetical protein AJ79_09681 [Helicocarpus griseus UAMH5409]